MKTEGEVLVILAKHETQTETGGSFVSKQFEQRFSLPSGVKPESIISSLGKDGTLKVTAPRTSSQPNLSFKKTRGALEEEVPNRAETTQNPANQGLSYKKKIELFCFIDFFSPFLILSFFLNFFDFLILLSFVQYRPVFQF